MKTILRYGISLALMLGFLYGAFHAVDLAAVWDAALEVRAGWLVLVVATILVTAFLRGWRWVVLLRHAEPQVTVVDATLALAICYSVNVVTPRMGEAARALSLKWVRGVKVSTVLGTVVVERVIDLVWLLFFIGLSAALIPGRIDATFPHMRVGALVTLAVTILAIAGLVTVSAYGDRGVDVVRRLVARLSARLADRVADFLRHFVHGLLALRTPSAYLEILLSSVLLNLGYIAIIWQAHAAFGFHLEPYQLGIAAAVVVMAISSIGVVIPAPGGTGTYHFFYSTSLQALFGIPQAPALACATLVHAISNLTYVAVGVPALLIQRARRGRRDASLSEEMAAAQADG